MSIKYQQVPLYNPYSIGAGTEEKSNDEVELIDYSNNNNNNNGYPVLKESPKASVQTARQVVFHLVLIFLVIVGMGLLTFFLIRSEWKRMELDAFYSNEINLLKEQLILLNTSLYVDPFSPTYNQQNPSFAGSGLSGFSFTPNSFAPVNSEKVKTKMHMKGVKGIKQLNSVLPQTTTFFIVPVLEEVIAFVSGLYNKVNTIDDYFSGTLFEACWAPTQLNPAKPWGDIDGNGVPDAQCLEIQGLSTFIEAKHD
jgi:hypothetical protein